jgi:hypothetical protein
MKNWLQKLSNALRIFIKLLKGKPLTVLEFNSVLATFPDEPMAKIVHETRKFRAIQFILKMPKPKNKKTKRGVAW